MSAVTQTLAVQFLNEDNHQKAVQTGQFSTLRDLMVFLQQSGAILNTPAPLNRTHAQQVVYLFGRCAFNRSTQHLPVVYLQVFRIPILSLVAD